MSLYGYETNIFSLRHEKKIIQIRTPVPQELHVTAEIIDTKSIISSPFNSIIISIISEVGTYNIFLITILITTILRDFITSR